MSEIQSAIQMVGHPPNMSESNVQNIVHVDNILEVESLIQDEIEHACCVAKGSYILRNSKKYSSKEVIHESTTRIEIFRWVVEALNTLTREIEQRKESRLWNMDEINSWAMKKFYGISEKNSDLAWRLKRELEMMAKEREREMCKICARVHHNSTYYRESPGPYQTADIDYQTIREKFLSWHTRNRIYTVQASEMLTIQYMVSIVKYDSNKLQSFLQLNAECGIIVPSRNMMIILIRAIRYNNPRIAYTLYEHIHQNSSIPKSSVPDPLIPKHDMVSIIDHTLHHNRGWMYSIIACIHVYHSAGGSHSIDELLDKPVDEPTDEHREKNSILSGEMKRNLWSWKYDYSSSRR